MTYEVITTRVPNSKGLGLAAEIYRPQKDGKLPVVFIFHGFTGYKESADLVDLADRLAKQGVVAVRFTSSGFGDSDGTLVDDYRFTNYRSDAESVYQYVTRLAYADTTRMGVVGHSMGGKLAVLFCADHPDITVLGVLAAPVTFLGTAYGPLQKEWREKGYFEKVSGRDQKTIRIPYAYALDVDTPEHDVLAAAATVTHAEALVVAGLADTEVPWRETKRIFDALPSKKIWKLLPGIPHKYGHQKALIPVVNTPVAEFIAARLLRD
jgi:dienelactone hydrolase